jgi:hypothetical protein
MVGPISGAAALLLLLGSSGWTKGRLGAIVKSFGLYSLGVYLMHPAVKLAIERLLIAPVHPLYLVVCAALLPGMTLILVRLLARSPIGRLLT